MLKGNRGYSITEILILLVVSGILLTGILKLSTAFQSRNYNVSVETKAEKIALAIQTVAENIIEIWKPYCTGVLGEENLGWGWRSSRCNQVRIFPALPNATGSRGNIVYVFNTGVLSSNDLGRMEGIIKDAFAGVCNVDTSQVSSGRILVFCPDFYAMRYCLNSDCSNNTDVVHQAGRSYDYIGNRIVGIGFEYDLFDIKGKVSVQKRFNATTSYEKPYIVSFASFYVKMDQKNKERFLRIYNALIKYEVTKRVSEIKTTNPYGLKEIDDFYIPWVYQITASNSSNAFLVSNDTNATNLQNDNVWKRNIGSTDLKVYSQNISNYLFGGSLDIYYDAWGNPLGIELLTNSTALTTCRQLYSPGSPGGGSTCLRIINPPYPQQDYHQVFQLRPPFVGYIYSEFCYDLNNATQNACRLPVVYAN